MQKNNILVFLLICLVSTIAWFFKPEVIETNSWHVLVIFIATILCIMSNILPLGVIGILSITVFALTKASGAVDSENALLEALNAFNDEIAWLIVLAFLITQGFIKTGLGKRIALIMIKYFGNHTLGLAYGLALADLFIAPITPSNTARCGGVIFPITQAIAQNFASTSKDSNKKRIKEFLLLCILNMNNLTSALFITAYSANPLIVKLAANYGVIISWSDWFIAAFAPILILFILTPVFLYFIIKPEIQETPEVLSYTNSELEKMGPFSAKEFIMCCIFFFLLLLWVFGPYLDLSTTIAAMIGVVALLLTNVLSWDDIIKNKQAWETFIWYAALLMLANTLNKLGLMQWFGNQLGEQLSGLSSSYWILSLVLLNMIYTYLHYFFASGMAHVAALYSIFLGIGINLGIPAYPLALMLAFSSSLFCSLAQYSHAKGPILFASNYVSTKKWWSINFVVNLFNQVVFIIVGTAWWKMVGFY